MPHTCHIHATMLTIKQCVMHVLRVVHQFCELHHYKWSLHGPLVQSLLTNDKDGIGQHPMDFVINHTYQRTLASPIEALAFNLRINGFHMETSSSHMYKLQSTYQINGTLTAITVCLRSTFPMIHFTSDSILLDSTGFTIRQLSSTADCLNTCKGIAMLDRIMDIQDKEVTADTTLLPFNYYKCHKEHNIKHIEQLNDAYTNGLTIKGASIPLEKSEEDCPVCIDSGKASTLLVCGHTFCLSCIQKILRTEDQPRCPLCRSELSFTTPY